MIGYHCGTCASSVLQKYNATLDLLLTRIKICDKLGFNACSESVKLTIDTFYSEIIACIKQAITTCIPYRNGISANYSIPGWNTHVREKHDAAREAFLLWKDNGRPRQGSLCDEMRQTRAHFKLALRYCKGHIEQMKADACADACFDKDARKFWNTVQRISNSKATSLINSINNISGEQNIADMWQEHFKQLYNSCSNTAHSERFQNKVMREESMNNVANLHVVSVYDVLFAMSELKTGKAVGPDGIPAEAFIYGGHRLAVLLCYFFNACILYGYLPPAFTASVIVPIIKNKAGQLSDVNNYRAIAIANACSKVLESIIYKYVATIDGCITDDPHQFGFKRGHSTDICTYVLKNTVRYYTLRNSHVFSCFVDFNKAFDNVDYWLLFSKMYDMFLDAKAKCFIRLLACWYSTQTTFVRWQNAESVSFSIANGVRQGGILSPFLFRIYIRDLITCITSLRLGCNVAGTMINLLCFADDMVLLAPSWSGLQFLIDKLHQAAIEINMTFNVSKTVCMVFKPANSRYIICDNFPAFSTSGQSLAFVTQFKYLGHVVCNDQCDDEDIKREIKALFTRCNILTNRFKRCSRFVKIRLFQTYCLCLFGTVLWSSFTSRTMQLFISCFNKCVKRFFGFAKYDSVTAMFANLGISNAQGRVQSLNSSFTSQVWRCHNWVVRSLLTLGLIND